MYRKQERPEGKKSKVKIFIKTDNRGGKKEVGELDVEYIPITTAEVNKLADDDLYASEIFDQVVERIGPVGHPTETESDGSPKRLPDDEAKVAVREDFEAMQQVVVDFWEVHSVDPKRKTSGRRRSRG